MGKAESREEDTGAAGFGLGFGASFPLGAERLYVTWELLVLVQNSPSREAAATSAAPLQEPRVLSTLGPAVVCARLRGRCWLPDADWGSSVLLSARFVGSEGPGLEGTPEGRRVRRATPKTRPRVWERCPNAP